MLPKGLYSITDKYTRSDNMIKCDRCGEKVEDYYFVNYIHANHFESDRYVVCRQCMLDLKQFMENINSAVSFTVPDGYNIIKGDKD